MSESNERILAVFGLVLLMLGLTSVAISSSNMHHPWLLAGILLALGGIESILFASSAILRRSIISRTLHILLLSAAVLLCSRLASFLDTPLWVLAALPAVAMALLWRGGLASVAISVFLSLVLASALLLPPAGSKALTLDSMLRLVLQIGYLWLSILLLLPLLEALDQHRATRREEFKRATAQHMRLEAILSAISTAVVVVDRSGWIRRANRAAEDLTGRSSSILEGILVDAVVHLGWSTAEEDLHDRMGRSEIPVKGGEPIPVAYRILTLGSEDDYLVLLHDLRAQYAELAAMESRSMELEAASQSGSRFVAGVSHELRTPLDAMCNEANLLLDSDSGRLEPEQRRFAGIIKRNAASFQELVDDMLMISKLHAGLAKPAREEITALRLIREADWKKPAQFDHAITAGGKIPLLCVDRGWTERIFEEIVDPLPFVGPTEGRVAHRLIGNVYQLDIPSRRLEPGHDDTFIFGPHFPEHEGPSPYSSSRLGLNIARQLARSMGGELRTAFDSEGSGRFILELPVTGFREA